MRKRRPGRVTLPFATLERVAADVVAAGDVFLPVENMSLSRKSGCWRRKDGSLSFCLIWQADGGWRVVYSIKGVRPQRHADA